jgi:hypothetical protein
VLIGPRSRRGDHAIADTTHRLQEQRIGGVALDLAPQAVDLHVDRTLVHGAITRQCVARHRFAPRQCQNPQHIALAVGETNDFLALPQFAAFQMIDVRTECDLLQRLDRWRRGALEDIADAQGKLARFERFCDVIVGADLQALDPACRLVARRQHDDRYRR